MITSRHIFIILHNILFIANRLMVFIRTFIIIISCLLAVLNGSAQKVDRDRLLNDIKTLSSRDFSGRKPGTMGHQKARTYLAGRFQALALKPFQEGYLDTFAMTNGLTGYNIIGYIPGKREDAIVISGHYDHLGERNGAIYYGADDNASGASALLALAAYFSGHRPNHTLIFAAFDAEEMGLQGARAFVRAPPIPLDRIVLNVNMDMVSRNDNNELYASGTYHYPFLSPFIKSDSRFITLKTGHDQPGSGHDDWTKQSDHAAFHEAGIPFIYFGVEDHPDYHTPRDTYERIQPDFFHHAVLAILDVLENIDKETLPSPKLVRSGSAVGDLP